MEYFIPSNRSDKQGKPTHMDGWNEIIKANRSGYYIGARQERENVEWVAWHTRQAMRKNHVKPYTSRVRVDVCFVEVNRRRDPANAYGGLKWLLDGMTKPKGGKAGAGLIVDDSTKWLEVGSVTVDYDKNNPGVIVRITPAE
jgi:hypothetical protein